MKVTLLQALAQDVNEKVFFSRAQVWVEQTVETDGAVDKSQAESGSPLSIGLSDCRRDSDRRYLTYRSNPSTATS